MCQAGRDFCLEAPGAVEPCYASAASRQRTRAAAPEPVTQYERIQHCHPFPKDHTMRLLYAVVANAGLALLSFGLGCQNGDNLSYITAHALHTV
jgi:hypothetical protein